MTFQLRSFNATLLRLPSWSNSVSVCSTVTNTNLRECEKSHRLLGSQKASEHYSDPRFLPVAGVIPKNTRLGVAIYQGKKIVRHVRRKLSHVQPQSLSRSSASAQLGTSVSLFPWHHPPAIASSTTTDTHPLAVYKDCEVAVRLFGEIGQVAQPLEIRDDDIIVHQAHPGCTSVLDTPLYLYSESGNTSSGALCTDHSPVIFKMRRHLNEMPACHIKNNVDRNLLINDNSVQWMLSSQVNSRPVEDEKPDMGPKHGPSEAQLAEIHNRLADMLPTFFVKTSDYSIYHKDIVLENNFYEKPSTTVGLQSYVFQMLKLRWWAHWRYSNVKLVILKITHHKEDGTVRVRWRISGLPQVEAIKVWKFLPWVYRKNLTRESEWHDAFSVYWVGSDGLIHKHKVDRIMPDEEREVAKGNKLTAKLAGSLG